jgi:hypothetical protein
MFINEAVELAVQVDQTSNESNVQDSKSKSESMIGTEEK